MHRREAAASQWEAAVAAPVPANALQWAPPVGAGRAPDQAPTTQSGPWSRYRRPTPQHQYTREEWTQWRADQWRAADNWSSYILGSSARSGGRSSCRGGCTPWHPTVTWRPGPRSTVMRSSGSPTGTTSVIRTPRGMVHTPQCSSGWSSCGANPVLGSGVPGTPRSEDGSLLRGPAASGWISGLNGIRLVVRGANGIRLN